MKIIIATLPITGRANPALNVGSILVKAGHDVVFTSARAFGASADSCGLKFIPSPGTAEDLTDLSSRFPERDQIPVGPDRILFDFKHVFCDAIPSQYQGLLSILEAYSADVIVTDNLFGGVLPFLLREGDARPAIVGLGVNPLLFHRDDHAPFGLGLPPAHPSSPAAEEYRRIAKDMNARLNDPIRAYIDEILQTLGVGPLPMPFLDSLVALPDLFLQLGSPSVEMPRSDLPKSVHVVGILPSFTKGDLPSDLKPLLESGRSVVVVTQGTLANNDLDQVMQPTLDAMAGRDDVLVVGTTGGRPVSALQRELPKNAMVFSYLPLDEMLAHASVFVTNGGFGSVCRALSLGLPMVVAGKGEDKADVAMLVAQSGAGVNLQTDRPIPEALRNAINAVLKDGSSYQTRTRELARELEQIDTSEKIVALLKLRCKLAARLRDDQIEEFLILTINN